MDETNLKFFLNKSSLELLILLFGLKIYLLNCNLYYIKSMLNTLQHSGIYMYQLLKE